MYINICVEIDAFTIEEVHLQRFRGWNVIFSKSERIKSYQVITISTAFREMEKKNAELITTCCKKMLLAGK